MTGAAVALEEPPPPIDPGGPDHGEEARRLFRSYDLDLLLDGLLSGRLAGLAVEPRSAVLLLSLLQRAEWKTHSREFAGALPHFTDSYSISDLRTIMRNLGYDSRILTAKGRQLPATGAVTVIRDRRGEFWLVDLDAGTGPRLLQPGIATLPERSRRIRAAADYEVIVFEPLDAATDPTETSTGSASWFEDTWSRFRPEFRLALVLSLLSGVVTILVSFAITMIFDVVVRSGNTATIWAILAGVLLIFLFDFLLRGIKARMFGHVAGRMEFVLGSALFGKLLTLPTHMIGGAPISEQMSRLRQFETIRDLFAGPAALLALEMPVALLLLTAIAVIAWPLGLTLTAFIILFTGLASLLIRPIRRQTAALSSTQSALTRLMLEILANRWQIGRDALAWKWSQKFDTAVRDLARRRRSLTVTTATLDAIAHASLPLSAATIIFSGAFLVIDGHLSGGQLVAVTILTWRVVAPFQQLIQIMTKLPDLIGLVGQIDTLMRIPSEDGQLDEPGINRIKGPLSMKSVVVRYPKSILPTIVGASFDIPHGGRVALTGPSGSGKTTLLRVISGQMAPQSGMVRLGRANVRQMSLAYRGRNIAFVSQQPLYFYGTVAQNLRFAKPVATDEELEELLTGLGLGDWLAQLSDGINTRLDPMLDKSLLSNGVGSAIAVAQALLSQPSLLLLDEPAGGHDPVLEQALLDALRTRHGRITCILVTQRPSIIRAMDAVMTVAEGNVRLQRVAAPDKAAG